MNDIEPALNLAMRRIAGKSDRAANLRRLTGGANMQSWSFDHGGNGYVLRHSPNAELMAGRAFEHEIEAQLVRAVGAAGVMAPEIVGELEPGDSLGTGYVMRRVEAEVSPARILADPPPSLLGQLARELAAIHSVSHPSLPALPSNGAVDLLAELKARFIDFGGDRPVMALAFKWLEDHQLPPVEPVLVHGDFRMGNIMVDQNGALAAVLDWELARFGDRHQDLAYGCINSWRFGHIDRPAFGLGSLDEYWAAYRQHGGEAVDPARFRWWLVYSSLWWGVCCLQMADIWRSGKDGELERAVIGRRASETEVDLLMLLEADAPHAERHIRIGPVSSASSATFLAGEPSAPELLGAVSNWIEADIRAHASGRDRFMAAVALNALGIVARELGAEAAFSDKQLSTELLSGDQSLATPGLLARLKRSALHKLAVDQPRYSALAAATHEWSE